MARGFESKQVEEQQSAAQRRETNEGREQLTAEQQKAKRERTDLELVRSKLQSDLAASTNERHRSMLVMALKDVEKKLGI